jgi:hypothetical protein
MAASRRWIVPAVLGALLVALAPADARAQNLRNCAWPVELSPEAYGNFLAPEFLARYWLMPFDEQVDAMTIRGTYLDARYFSFVVYDTDDAHRPTQPSGRLYDAAITPDPGTVNPFVKPGGAAGTYTVVVSRSGAGPGNVIPVDSNFAWILLRVYVASPDASLGGNALSGHVALPTLTVTGSGGTHTVEPCSTVNKLDDLRSVLQTFFPAGFDLVGDEGTPSSDRLWFGAPSLPPPLLLPNPDNKYLATFPGNTYQPGRIIVIRGKAPSFPGTYDGSPVWVADRGHGPVDMRFWSFCNNDLVLPVSAVACTTDFTAHLEGGHYTIVISDDLRRPAWLRPDVDWLPWGDAQYPKLVFFRNLLPSPGFPHSIQKALDEGCTFEFNLPYLPDRAEVDVAGRCAAEVMGDYYPVAAWCDKARFLHGGWRACLREP